ncbi:substrate-binding periplasmic protein [Neptunomonas marina]|uniref:substrate-binding periplasmic protein n=1 Tax=Neptunomonas marina TaxID=1815562 RepID=UPI0013E2DC37|nr:transporter substrate-binding domain-containing protein [Neptunomonas marina]
MKTLLSLVLCLFSLSLSANELIGRTSVHVAAAEYLPFTSRTLPQNGVLLDLTRAAFKAQAIAVRLTFMPWSRALSMTQGGQMEALVAGFYSDARSKTFIYSDSLMQATSIFVSRREGISAHQLVNGLTDLRVAVEAGSIFERQLAGTGTILEPVTHLEQGLRMLVLGRVDLVLGTEAYLDKMITTRFTEQEQRHFKPLRLFKGKHSLHLLFPKTAKGAKLRSAFNDGLAKLMQTHEYHAILRRHHYIK